MALLKVRNPAGGFYEFDVLSGKNGNSIYFGTIENNIYTKIEMPENWTARVNDLILDNKGQIWQIKNIETKAVVLVASALKGADGKNGKDGKDGKDGEDGIFITKSEINAGGELVFTFSDESTINVGKVVGADGTNGKDGNNGADAPVITNIVVNEDGQLVITLSNEETYIAGMVVGAPGTNGEDGNGISGIELISTEGLVDTYQINFTKNETPYQFTIKNGQDGKDGQNYTLTAEDIAEIRKDMSSLKVERTTEEELASKTETNIIYLIPVGDAENPDYYLEYIIFNGKPELIGSTQIPLEEYASLQYVKEKSTLYRHNIIFKMADRAGIKNGTIGGFQATFTLINNDPNSYAFIHEPNKDDSTTYVMDSEKAWNFLRLYYAMATSSKPEDDTGRYPCSGTVIKAGGETRGIIHYVYAEYENPQTTATETSYTRVIGMSGTILETAESLNGYKMNVACGRAVIVDGEDTKGLWKDKKQFEDEEYNVNIYNNVGSYFFCRHQVYCVDYVEKLQPYV